MEEKKCPKCGRMYPVDALICPGCKHPNNAVEHYIEQQSVSNNKSTNYVSRSAWYTYATIIFVLSFLGLILLVALGISEGNTLLIIGGIGEFVSVSLICAIVQLLAGIKFGIDNISHK